MAESQSQKYLIKAALAKQHQMNKLKVTLLFFIALMVLNIAYNVCIVVSRLEELLQALVSAMETIVNRKIFGEDSEPYEYEYESGSGWSQDWYYI